MTRSDSVLWIPLAVVLALVALAGCRADSEPLPAGHAAELPFYADATFAPHWFPTRTSVPDSFHTIGSFTLTDQEGRTITDADLDGQITIANFFFASCPGICPMTMANMARLQDAFAADEGVVLVSHSITPGRDSVSVLAEFARRTNVRASTWRLVTGDRDTMYDLGKTSYFADEDLGEQWPKDEAAFTHTESFYLVDQDRHIRGIYNGMSSASVDQLIADVRMLQTATRS